MYVERLKLYGADWARYFAPVAFCAYLAVICVALIVTSAFLHNLSEALAVTAAAVFGLLLSCALGMGVLGMQLRELRYLSVPTAFDSESNFELVARLARGLGWQLTRKEPGRRLDARTTGSLLQQGELVVVQFRPQQVLIASICDPGVGFSLVGRRRCQQNRELVRRAILRQPPA
ncbi:MAG: hypothetical protein WA446_03065 [Steroidobacteraceae bacterium]